MGIYGAIAGAAAARAAESRCVEKLKKANATSPENAVKPEDVGILHEKKYSIFIESPTWEWEILERLIRRGEVRKTDDGRVYVECKDEEH
ncbi:MAG: hypothetical protein ABSC91_03345 [Candidatus Bathyarchaeia archaeon]|jgi:hypothetical protein